MLFSSTIKFKFCSYIILLISLVLYTDLSSQPVPKIGIDIYHYSSPESDFYFSKEGSKHFERIQKKLITGIKKLQNKFSLYGLPKKPSFWFLKSKHSLIKKLANRCDISQNQIKHKNQGGILRTKCGMIIVYSEGTEEEEILRIVFQEYAMGLVGLVSGRPRQQGWFEVGLPVYLSWVISGELSGKTIIETHADILKYYSSYFNPSFARSLSGLENKNEWDRSFRLSARQTLGQSVVSYMYWASKTNHGAGVQLLIDYKNSDDFLYEFKRLSGLSIKEFEADLKKNVYPEVERWRASLNHIKKDKKSFVKTWPILFTK